MQVKAIYAGTFDPITNGHIDIIKRSMKFCSQLIVAIGVNPNKKTLFSEEERLSLINRVVEKELDFLDSTNVSALSFNGLLVDYAREDQANILIRGIRSVSDFEYEINLASINKVLAPQIETVFLPTSPELAVVSSSMVKEIARYGGDIKRFVPEVVAKAVYEKINNIAK
jgi:pantetheine-phosphate adenylyltransferase